jgi:hypothetical protein
MIIRLWQLLLLLFVAGFSSGLLWGYGFGLRAALHMVSGGTP